MPAVITLLYPAVEFDIDYYINKHMSIVASKWGSAGFQSWQVVKLDPSSGHAIQCIMVWDSVEAFGKAQQGKDGVEIREDIANFTKGTPVVTVGEIAGSG